MPTPIRIRGRRKKPWTPEDDVPKPIPSGPKGGRPMLSFEAKEASSQSSQSRKRARLQIANASKPKRRKELARLEMLPVELIEKIFLYSLNVNVPRASLPLAVVLSSERIYRTLSLLAFWNDCPALAATATAPTETPFLPRSKSKTADLEIARLLRPLDYSIPPTEEERRALQKSILSCRWCTYQRLLGQIPDLMQLSLQRHWFSLDITMPADQEEGLEQFLVKQNERQEQDTVVPATFSGVDNVNTYTLSITSPVSMSITCTETNTKTSYHTLSVLAIPDHILQGNDDLGFTDDHLRLLEILRVAAGFSNPDLIAPPSPITFSREALQQGIRIAIVSRNAPALTTLLKVDEYIFRSQHTNATATTSVPYSLPSEHFHTATSMAKDDPIFFQLLLRASAESVPADDSDITQWAMDIEYPLGSWLLDFMLVLPQQREAARLDPVHASAFYLGRANSQIAIVRRYLTEVLEVDELGEWMEESFL